MAYDSPCFTCTRVRDPQNCENKTCKDWQAWFIDRWETMREHVRARMDEAPLHEVGVPLAGHAYTSPHRVREYLKVNPCSRCLCPKNTCRTPCPAKQAWDSMRKEVSHELES